MDGSILVATDGSTGALGALRMARALAERDRLGVRVVSAVVPHVGYAYAASRGVENDQAELLRGRVEAQVRSVLAAADPWPVDVVIGAPPPAIVRAAANHQAGMILLGFGRHDRLNRWLGTETALKVIHLAHVPVWVVPRDAWELPRRALVGIDFSEFCHDAARVAAEVLEAGGTLHLAHVIPLPEAGTARESWDPTCEAGARRLLEELAPAMIAGRPLAWEVSVDRGEPAPLLLEKAAALKADLIAVGSHGTGFWGRLLAGSVSTRLLRLADRPVLVAPPRTVPAIPASRFLYGAGLTLGEGSRGETEENRVSPQRREERINVEHTDLPIRDLGCAGGSARTLEHVLARVPGVVSVYVNPVTETASVEHDPDRCTAATLVGVVRELGFEVGAAYTEQATNR